MSIETYLHMGGYAMNVWGSYGLAAIVYGGLMTTAISKLHKLSKGKNKNQ